MTMTAKPTPLHGFDAPRIKKEFPALQHSVNGRPVCFLDSAASAQKPQAVIDAMADVQQQHYANVHRGLYKYSQDTTTAFEQARVRVAKFLNTSNDREVIFTRNATEAINLVAHSWGRANLKPYDEIILTVLEHHANIVPWHMLREEIGFTIKVVPIKDDGAIDLEAFEGLLSDKVKFVGLTHMSNAIGTIVPVKEMTQMAKTYGATVLVDASQAVVHMNVDVQNIGCDFLSFTGHKLYGPTGVGILYGREEILNALRPYQGGGEMIDKVSFDQVTYKQAPARFEAGTPAIVEAIGLGAAIEWLSQWDKAEIQAHEKALLDYAMDEMGKIDGVNLYGTTADKSSILSFNIQGVHPHDAGTIFDQMGVAVRAGHHCAQPLMQAMNVSATLRASFAIYNTMDDVDRLIEAVNKVKKLFC